MDNAFDPTGQPHEDSDKGKGEEAAKDVTLEEEVKQLVGSVSSWWTGFSKRSQEQINAARKEIETQGGLVSIARKEAQRFEAQLSEAQKTARERAQGAEGESGTSKGKATEESGKGKGREVVVEGDDGAEVEALAEKARRKSRSESRSEPMITGTGEAIFDVDGNPDEERKSVDETINMARQNAQTALQNVQSFWDRLQEDPRLNSIQASLAKTLESVSLPKVAGSAKGAGAGTSDEGSTSAVSFTDVTKQFQASFPHLNWKESQALAKKYYDASENVARDWGKEMNTLMSDLVKIIPPEEKEKEASMGATADEVAATRQPSNAPAAEKGETRAGREGRVPGMGETDALLSGVMSTEEEDFDWDGEVDGHSASTGLQTTTGPPTTSWEGSESDSTHHSRPASGKTAGGKESKEEDDEVESDWE